MDKIEKKIFNVLKTIGLIILLLTFQAIPIFLFGIVLNRYSLTARTLYLLITDIILIIIFILLYKKDIIKDFKKYFNKNIFDNLKTSITYWIIGLIIMLSINYIIVIITKNGISQNEQSVRELIDKVPLYMIFISIIYAPITEEIIFRKSIKNITDNKYLYPILSGLSFGIMHVILSMKSTQELIFIIPYSAIGYVFAKCYQKTNNIFSTITAHALHNSLTLIIYLTSKFV